MDIVEEESFFELGNLYFDRGEFDKAIPKSELAANVFLQGKNYKKFLKCQSILLRAHAERCEFDKVNQIKENLQDLILNEGFELNAQTYYTLGISSVYKDQFDQASDYFRKSLELALKSDEKEDICYAINGIAIVYYMKGELTDSLKEIYNLKVFFQVLDLPKLKLSSYLLNAAILRSLGRCDEALDLLWSCYDLLRIEKSMLFQVSLLINFGLTYQEMGEGKLAETYLRTAKQTVDPVNMVRSAKRIDQNLEKFGIRPQNEFDLIYNEESNSVTERKKGRVDFKNQFILLDLLHLFMRNPGKTFSKKELVQTIWKQDYNPRVHDNKIYVTIKRLRKMIEPDYEQPKYVFRAKNGYYLNKSVRVMLDS